MRIRRTACAGVLLELDGKRFLMDGVCREVEPYPATPPEIRQDLEECPPDALLITHSHADHYDEGYVSWYQKSVSGPILGPGDIPFARAAALDVGSVHIAPVPSRHIGRMDGLEHISFILQGSECIWFLGDSSPLLWKNRPELPRPDIMIVPYAYGMGSGWELCRYLAPKAVILLHLPDRRKDCFGLWDGVAVAAGQGGGPRLYIPAMGELRSISPGILEHEQ